MALQLAMFVRNIYGLLVRLENLDHGGDHFADFGGKRGPISESLSTCLLLVHGLVTPRASPPIARRAIAQRSGPTCLTSSVHVYCGGPLDDVAGVGIGINRHNHRYVLVFLAL
jgi:hypothetical protein